MKTILFGTKNSRKKMNKKVVIVLFTDGIVEIKAYYYEKKSKRWQFITNDITKIQCDEPEFIKIKELWGECNGKIYDAEIKEKIKDVEWSDPERN